MTLCACYGPPLIRYRCCTDPGTSRRYFQPLTARQFDGDATSRRPGQSSEALYTLDSHPVNN